MRINALHNCTNPFQGKRKKVLAVCSAGLLRSPTIAWVLSNEPFGFNTRAVGTGDYALVQLDEVHLHWADEIITVSEYQVKIIEELLKEQGIERDIFNMNLPDRFEFRNPELVDLIVESYTEYQKLKEETNAN
jgi:predicted protein tyrosine phosphatase